MKSIFNSLLLLSALTSATLLAPNANAIPVVNENAANNGVLTIYPDHADPHRFYIAPNVVMLAKDQSGKPQFSYSTIRRSVGKYGILQMTFLPTYTQTDLAAAQAEILSRDPAAQFSGVPFISSQLKLTNMLSVLIAEHTCTHTGGQIAQELGCSMLLSTKGRRFFEKTVERRSLFITLDFVYSFQAVVRKADGSFQDQPVEHAMAARIDGDQLANYPELIQFH